MPFPGTSAKGPNDQKTLNEELLAGLVEVARRNPQHAVELFGVPLSVAVRIAAMSEAWLDDLATTPAALWRPALTERLIRQLPARQPTPMPAHEVYRPIVERINRLALATLIRYADDPIAAALVCDIADPQVVRALQELPTFAFIEWGGNVGTPLIVPLLTDMLLDRLLRGDEGRVEPRLRGLFAMAALCEAEFEELRLGLQHEAQALGSGRRGAGPKRCGRPPSIFLMPRTSSLVLMMLRHQMRPSEVEGHMAPGSSVRATQLRGLAQQLNPRPKREKGAPRDRSRDSRDLWGSAQRRLTATAILRLQRRLVTAGIESFEAMVHAYDYFSRAHDADCGVTLSRMLKDVLSALHAGHETHLSHCHKCGIVHLANDDKAGIIECPSCVLARAGKLGQRRSRVDRLDPVAFRHYGGWAEAGWTQPLAAEQSRA